MSNLSYLFSPASVAVIGASARKGTLGEALLSNLLRSEFAGVVYPVNPNREAIHGVRCHRKMSEVPGDVDLAILAIPAEATPGALDECGAKGVRAAIIVSAGFRESDRAGQALEAEVQRVARKWQIPVMGPNCLGVLNTDPAVCLNASFATEMPRVGNVAFVSKSGAVCTAVLELASRMNVGISKLVSMGNMAVVGELDVLRYLAEDDRTSVILMYLEELSDGQGFIELAREITGEGPRPKPILTVRSGRRLATAGRTQTHTAALVGTDEVYDAIFEQSGVLRVDTIEELFQYAQAFSALPLPGGNRVAIVTNAGGPGIMAVDACCRYGLEIATLEPVTLDVLGSALPREARISNPVDLLGDAQHDRYEAALKAVVADRNVDSVIVIMTPQVMTDMEEIASAVTGVDRSKPIVASFMGLRDLSQAIRILGSYKMPHYPFPESAARSLAVLDRYSRWRRRPRTTVRHFDVDRFEAERVVAAANRRGATDLGGLDAERLLAAYGFPTLQSRVASDVESAVVAARDIGFPVAMKALARGVVHTYDAGGVRLDLRGEAEVRTAWIDITKNLAEQAPGAVFEGVLLQAMAPPGKEVILGLRRDPQFGPILMFGLGGLYVDAYHDVAFRLAPIRELSAHDMVRSIRAASLLQGVRGEPPSDTARIADCLMRLSQLAVEHPEIVELDINPLLVYPDHAKVVDVRMILSFEKAPSQVRERRFLRADGVERMVSALAAQHRVYGPRAKDNCFVFSEIENPADLRLDYDTTILPPKKIFLPDQEPLLQFSVADSRVEEPEIGGSTVLFGVHPCDLIAIDLLDRVFSDGHCDRNYLERRKRSYLIGLDCGKKCNESSYCDAMVCYKTEAVYDLRLTPIEGGYAVEVRTEKGSELLSAAPPGATRELEPAEYQELKAFEAERERVFAARPIDFRILPRALWKSYSSGLWREQAERCFSCGVCNVVCPTCYCFDVCEEVDIAGTCGQRVRTYDGCMLRDFTLVASGEVFREKRAERLRHRELRKGLYLPEKFDFHTFCVGCGRCVKSCLADISPLDSFLAAQREMH